MSCAIIDKVEVCSLKLKLNATCAMFVVGFRPSFVVFNKFIKSHWLNISTFRALVHDDGYFFS